jgi:hypothetical protein
MLMQRRFPKQAPVGGGNAAGYAAPLMTAPSGDSKAGGRGSSWYEAMARAWGDALDRQANTVQTLSDQIGNGGQDTPAVMVELTAQSLKMGFLSNSASSSVNSVGDALQTLGRKQ